MVEGRYIGHHGRTGSLLVLTPEGVKRGVGVRRLPPAERWSREGWDLLRGLPWDVVSRQRKSVLLAVLSEQRALVAQPSRAPAAKRQLHVLAADIEHFGVAEGCAGCESVMVHGKAPPGVGHNEQCRSRVEETLSREQTGRGRLERHIRKGRGSAEDAPAADATERELDASEAVGEPAEKRKRPAPEIGAAHSPPGAVQEGLQVGGSSASSSGPSLKVSVHFELARSSSEFKYDYAWLHYFFSGQQDDVNKVNAYNIRAVRSF